MINFQISKEQVAKIAAALTAEELSRGYQIYTDFVTQSTWDGDTVLGINGLNLTAAQLQSSFHRLAQFFGIPDLAYVTDGNDSFDKWADVINNEITNQQDKFMFVPASRSKDAVINFPSANIWQDAAAISFLLQGRRRLINMVAPHSLFGLVIGILAPNLQGITTEDYRHITPDEMAEKLQFGDVILGTPTIWRYLNDTLQQFPSNVTVISFGENLDVELAKQLQSKRLSTIREVYGTTEHGIIAWRDHVQSAYTLFEHWQRDGGKLIRIQPNDEAIETSALDALEWQNDRAFLLGKRLDGAVQISAVNVFPNEVANIIAQHEDVKSCEVYLAEGTAINNRLSATITLNDSTKSGETMAWKIDSWCREKLLPVERPAIYHFKHA